MSTARARDLIQELARADRLNTGRCVVQVGALRDDNSFRIRVILQPRPPLALRQEFVVSGNVPATLRGHYRGRPDDAELADVVSLGDDDLGFLVRFTEGVSLIQVPFAGDGNATGVLRCDEGR